MTQDQLLVLKQDMAADPVFNALPQNADTAMFVKTAYNLPADPPYWVYKTALGEDEVYDSTSPDGTTWDWTTYIAQSTREADAWVRMFRRGWMNPAIPQARAGLDKIFAGTGQAVQAQRTHLHSLFRREATRAEQLFATGTGSPQSPGTMTWTGLVTGGDVEQAWAL